MRKVFCLCHSVSIYANINIYNVAQYLKGNYIVFIVHIMSDSTCVIHKIDFITLMKYVYQSWRAPHALTLFLIALIFVTPLHVPYPIRSDDWVEALPSQQRLQFLSSYVLFLVSSKNFYHHQVQLNGNFRLYLSIIFILSSFDVVFFSIWRIHGLSNRAPPHTLNTSITLNNKIANTPTHIANCFTKQFKNTVKHATHKTNRHINRATHNIQGYNITLTTSQVQGAVKQSKNNNSQGPDKLNIRHLKHIGPLGLAFLTSMFKTALNKT